MFKGKNASFGTGFTFWASKYEDQFYTYNSEYLVKTLKKMVKELEENSEKGFVQFQIYSPERKSKFTVEHAPDAELKFIVPNSKTENTESSSQDF